MQLENDVGRLCGECNACCKVFPVPEVGKHDSNWCLHCEIGSGCTIYDDRPPACELYACLWLNGEGDDNFRPDRLGVMVDVQGFDLPDREVTILHLWELETGAFNQQFIQELVEENKKIGSVIVFHRPIGNTYDTQMTMQMDLFTVLEVTLLFMGKQ